MKKRKELSRRGLSLLLAAVFCAALLPTVNLPAEAAVSVSEALNGIAYHGEASNCKMTAEQAEAYANAIDDEIARMQNYGYGYEWWHMAFLAALIDDGSGIPILFVAEGLGNYDNSGRKLWLGVEDWTPAHLWYYDNGKAVHWTQNLGYDFTIYSDHINIEDIAGWDYSEYESVPIYATRTFPISNGKIATKQASNWTNPDTNYLISCGYGVGAPEICISGRISPAEDVSKALRDYAFAMKLKNATPEEILAEMAYAGDRSKCRMTSAQAAAYADVLEAELKEVEDVWQEFLASSGSGSTVYPYAVLFDTGVGFPALLFNPVPFDEWAEYCGVWEYLNGQATKVVTLGYDRGISIFSDHLFYSHRGPMGVPNDVFVFQDGHIVPEAVSNTYLDMMVEDDDGGIIPFERIDGVRATSEELEAWLKKWDGDDYLYSTEYDRGGKWYGNDNARTLITLLRAYADAKKYPTYAYPQADAGDAHYADVEAAVAGKGTVQAIHRLMDDLYYVLLENGGVYTGAVVRGLRENGRPVWRVTQTDPEPAAEDALTQLVNRLLSAPNLKLDYSKLTGSPTLEGLTEYLHRLLASYEGLTPNDVSKTELAAFVDNAVTALASGSVSGKNNRLTLDSALVSDLARTAKNTWADLLSTLNDEGVALNKTVTPRARLLWQDLDAAKAFQITVDGSLISGLNNADLQLLLGSGERYIQFSHENLRQLLDELGVFSIQISQTGENTYTVNILDKDGQLLDSLSCPITLGLPASSMTSTVMVSYIGGSDNWGGQYDEASGVLTFEIRYSGQYEVLDNDLQIADIAELSEESQAAIRFMASKGYLSVENDLFRPGDLLTRYEFTEALVSMFFALDPSLTTTFPDVPQDSGYYAYVASAQARDIVRGLEGGTFSGELNITREQVFALAARTLIDQKGYAQPEDLDSYLSGFADRGSISDWAEAQVALAVREGIATRGGALYPQLNITREQAAVVLYRLFLKLYEVPPVSLDLPPESNVKSGPGMGIILAVAAAIGSAGAAFVIGKKKKVPVEK